MKRCFKKLSIFALILLASFLLSSVNVFAIQPLLPYLDFGGNFTYDYDTYTLSFSDFQPTHIWYSDGTDTTDAADDPILGDNVYFVFSGNFYNDEDQDGDPNNSGWNWIFGPDQPAGGNTGSVAFEIKNTTTNETFLTGEFTNFIVEENCITNPFPLDPTCTTTLNADYTLNALQSVVIDPYGNAPDSDYLTDYKNNNNSYSGLYDSDTRWTFTFNTGTGDFTDDSTGTIQGKIVMTPEPVSAILFVSGGAVLAVRRYRKRKMSRNIKS